MKKLYLLLILLYALPVQGASFLNDRTAYYQQTRLKLGVTISSSRYLNDTTASRVLSEAVVAIYGTLGRPLRLDTIVTSYYRGVYAIDTALSGVEAVWIQKRDSTFLLTLKHPSTWGEQAHNTTLGQESPTLKRPSFYYYTDSLLLIYPVPAMGSGDTIILLGPRRQPDITSDTSITDIPEKYRLAILNYMVWTWAEARTDPRADRFLGALNLSLVPFGMKIDGGKVAPAGN